MLATKRCNTSRFSEVKWFLVLGATNWSFAWDLSNGEVLAGVAIMIWDNLTTFGNSMKCWFGNLVHTICWFGFMFLTRERFDSHINNELMVGHTLFSSAIKFSPKHSSIAGRWCNELHILPINHPQHLYVWFLYLAFIWTYSVV